MDDDHGYPDDGHNDQHDHAVDDNDDDGDDVGVYDNNDDVDDDAVVDGGWWYDHVENVDDVDDDDSDDGDDGDGIVMMRMPCECGDVDVSEEAPACYIKPATPHNTDIVIVVRTRAKQKIKAFPRA